MNNAMLISASVTLTVWVSFAGTTSVATIDELTNAVAKAGSGDEIILKKSGSPYRFASDCRLSAYGHLATSKDIILRGESGDPKDVVIEGNANRILYCDGNCSAAVIRDLTFCNGDARNLSGQPNGGAIQLCKNQSTSVISNCIFTGNAAYRGGAVGIYQLPEGGTSARYVGACIDCIFSNNTATAWGGAIYGIKDLTRCLIQENTAGMGGGGVYQFVNMKDCWLVRNAMPTDESGRSDYGGGGAYLTRYGSSIFPTASGCRFIGNYSTYQGGGFYADGYARRAIVTNCYFEGNAVSTNSQFVYTSGGGVYNVTNVFDCVFTNNFAYLGGAASNSKLVRCGLYGNHAVKTPIAAYPKGGAANECELSWCTNRANATAYDREELERCRVTDSLFLHSGRGSIAIFGDSSFVRCRFEHANGGTLFVGTVGVTNCLVAHCGANADLYLVNGVNDGSCFVNCTFADNRFVSLGKTWYAGHAAMVNTLFYGNTVGGERIDIGPDTKKQINAFTNCIFSAASDGYAPGTDNLNYYGRALFSPHFVGADADPIHPYALKYNSPACRKEGTVFSWMASATDLKGDARLRDGKVNIGCYQCWLLPPGFIITFK